MTTSRPEWFIWDLGNVVIRLAWSRVEAAIIASSSCNGEALRLLMEGPGGYRDMESGKVSFAELFALVRNEGGYRGDMDSFRAIWSDFFDGTIEGIVPLIDRTRQLYRVAFLSNSNEVHEEVIPEMFPEVFRPADKLILSHRERSAKPDERIFERTLEILGAAAEDCIFVDDLAVNVQTARRLGFHAFRFSNAPELITVLEKDGLLPPAEKLS